jgi:hypothetical protein
MEARTNQIVAKVRVASALRSTMQTGQGDSAVDGADGFAGRVEARNARKPLAVRFCPALVAFTPLRSGRE